MLNHLHTLSVGLMDFFDPFFSTAFGVQMALLLGFMGIFKGTFKPRIKGKTLAKYSRKFLGYFLGAFLVWLVALGGIGIQLNIVDLGRFLSVQAVFLLVFAGSYLIVHFTRKSWLGYSVFGLGVVFSYLFLTIGLDAVSTAIGQYQFDVFGYHFTLLSIGSNALTAAVFFGVASFLSNVGNGQIRKIKKISSTTRSLLIKVWDVLVYVLALLFVLNSLGFKLTTFTVIGGALGVGIGFGLQKISSNFISGIILLFERSIEVNDLIEMGDIYGFVRRLGARFCLIETFDGKEVFVPNEDLITSRVTNWTYSNSRARVELTVGVSYNADPLKVQQLILEAAHEHEECLADPAPSCYLREFGDSSVNFLLYFFVPDVTKGRFQIHSEVMMSIWYKFKENGIEIPFPQRDVSIKNWPTSGGAVSREVGV